MDLKNNAKHKSAAMSKMIVSITVYFLGLKNAATALQLEKGKGAAAEIKRKFSVSKLPFPAIYIKLRFLIPGLHKVNRV